MIGADGDGNERRFVFDGERCFVGSVRRTRILLVTDEDVFEKEIFEIHQPFDTHD